jgi:small-conductance mechanosensitive channel
MIPFVLQELPVTHDYAVDLMASVKTHLWSVGDGILSFIPNLFFIAFVIFLTRSLIRFLKFIFVKIEKGYIVIDGFYPEWAGTTFQLLRFFVCMFALVIIYPYLPGSGTKALEGVSVFVGLMISLGSSSAIANIIAGVMISYMRAFKKGDYVKIGESMGKVTEKGLIVTKMMTYKNEEITIPNTQILSSQVTNYSTKAQHRELVLYTTITIGYDTAWTLVHKMMIEAAERSSLISKDKKPFVLQTALNDYHISYQLNAFTQHEDKIPGAYSELHQNIQQVFAENKVEIMSPGFTVLRNTPKDTTPVLS